MTTTRRGFLKSFVAAAGMAIARHYAPAALAAPKVMPSPLPVATLLHRMAEAVEKIPPHSAHAHIFWVNKEVYRRIVAAVRGRLPTDGEHGTLLHVNDRQCMLEHVGNVEESGALLSVCDDGSRSVIDVETGEFLQNDAPPPKPHYPFGRGFR